MFTSNIEMRGKKCDLKDCDCGTMVGARRPVGRISETADVLGFSTTAVFEEFPQNL